MQTSSNLPHRRAPVPKLSLVTSLASRPRNEVPLSTTTSLAAKPLILTEPKQSQRPELHSRQLASTSPTVTVTATRYVNASFLDDPTPIEPDMADQHASRAPRDSHDLSLSPRNITRDSLVNNMLLSLDQFSLGHATTTTTTGGLFGGKALTYDDPRPWANDDTPTTTFTRGRGARHHYSYSSDYDDDSARTSVQLPVARSQSRGRRGSNGSSTFQAPFPKLANPRDFVQRTQSDIYNNRPRAGTRSSTSSASIDAGYPQNIAGPSTWGRGGFRRSASFDLGPPQMQTQLNAPPLMSPFHLDFPTPAVSDDYAAPTPTIPGGPRRVSSNLALPRPPADPSAFPSLERNRSPTRSVKSSSGRTKRPANPQLVPPAMALSDFDSAPAPSVSYGKSKTEQPAVVQPGGAAAAAQPKEKPGFFRRVFGSFQTAAAEAPAPRFTSQASSNTALPAKDTLPPPPQQHHHQQQQQQSQPVLQKKPSSFFRRRKKSVADEAPPLPGDVPPLPSLHADFDRPASPASSLRQIMNPYLRESTSQPYPLGDITNKAAAAAGGADDDDHDSSRADFQRDFSPDYDPSPNAKIRAVHSDSDQDQSLGDDYRRPIEALEHRNNSFLDLDGGSDNEDSPVRKRATYSAADKENELRLASPTAYKSRDSTGTIRAKKSPYLTEQEKPNGAPVRPTVTIPTDAHRSTSYASASTDDGDYKTAPSGPPSVRIERTSESSPRGLGTLDLLKNRDLDEPEFVIGEPTEDDRQKALQIYDGVEGFIPKEKAAAWMGEEGPIRQRTLQAYIELYDFADLSILSALRKVCGRLVLRGETQQVDRILVAFSKRWCDCNPNHGFKATDVIHTICYSIMLLNTDLHLADIEQKMTRSQFVKNTLTTITQAVQESVPDAFERPSILPDKGSVLHDGGRAPAEAAQDKRSFRNSFRPPPRADTQTGDVHDECGPLVKTAFYGSMRAWEEQIELVLKTIYNSIRDDKLPLFGAEPERHLNTMPSQSSLSVMGMLKRSPSVLSKAPSESQMSTRGRIADNSRNGGSRWASKSRSRPGLGRTGFNSSRTSFDDANSLWSPAMSSATWSRYSLGRTQGSMSQDSFGSAVPRGDYQQSIGFANALSQAIVRDDEANGNDNVSILSADVVPATQMLDDESLELAGPPWVKEGRVMHKHHLDGVGKRAKDRNWTEVFAVIQRGQMSIFSFNAPKSTRQKSRTRNAEKVNAPVGGGNWQDNAVNLGTFNLRLTLASALPSPGYSRSRPYVWALSLPTGAVHLFQVGTPEIIKEFVNTANYWSARLSTHPLIGGISNIEYGWSDAVMNNSLVGAMNDNASILSGGGRNSRPGSRATHARQSSVQSVNLPSSSLDHGSGGFTNNSGRGKLPGDRITISEWAPPTQSMRPSNLPEAEQLEALSSYVKSIEEDLQNHNQLRSPMLLAYTPRGHNANKAMANWERKSAYLLREIVKFRTYVDTLQQSESRKREIYKERDLARRAARGELSDGDMDLSDDEGDETLRP